MCHHQGPTKLIGGLSGFRQGSAQASHMSTYHICDLDRTTLANRAWLDVSKEGRGHTVLVHGGMVNGEKRPRFCRSKSQNRQVVKGPRLDSAASARSLPGVFGTVNGHAFLAIHAFLRRISHVVSRMMQCVRAYLIAFSFESCTLSMFDEMPFL